jgi:[ribosomal protein S5]-alanine N-acetyltransferase
MENLHIAFRPWALSDIETLAQHANNKKIADNMRDRFSHPYTMEAAANFLEKALQFNPCQVFAVTANNEVCGSVGIFPKDDIERMNAEVGYWIAEPFWGRGIGTKALKFIIDYGFKTFAITRIFAIPFPHNIASQHVIQKSGMVLESVIKDCLIKNDVVMDEIIYAIRRENWKPQLPVEQ